MNHPFSYLQQLIVGPGRCYIERQYMNESYLNFRVLHAEWN